jgi:hypothetical protein
VLLLKDGPAMQSDTNFSQCVQGSQGDVCAAVVFWDTDSTATANSTVWSVSERLTCIECSGKCGFYLQRAKGSLFHTCVFVGNAASVGFFNTKNYEVGVRRCVFRENSGILFFSRTATATFIIWNCLFDTSVIQDSFANANAGLSQNMVLWEDTMTFASKFERSCYPVFLVRGGVKVDPKGSESGNLCTDTLDLNDVTSASRQTHSSSDNNRCFFIRRCTFNTVTSADNGGAVMIIAGTTGTFFESSDSDYTKCQGKRGGSVYVTVDRAVVLRVCFSSSTCTERDIALYHGQENGFLQLDSTSFWSCSRNSGVVWGFWRLTYEMRDTNVSDSNSGGWGTNADHNDQNFFNVRTECVSRFCVMTGLTTGIIFHIRWVVPEVQESFIYIDNAAKYVFDVWQPIHLTLRSCYFKNTWLTYFVVRSVAGITVDCIGCLFDKTPPISGGGVIQFGCTLGNFEMRASIERATRGICYFIRLPSLAFTASEAFVDSLSFSKTDGFSGTEGFTSTAPCSETSLISPSVDKFSNTETITDSNHFLGTDNISISEGFSPSEAPGSTVTFSETEKESQSNKFSKSGDMSSTNTLPESSTPSKSSALLLSHSFSKSDDISITTSFSQTFDFSSSIEQTKTDKFAETTANSKSELLTDTSSFSHTTSLVQLLSLEAFTSTTVVVTTKHSQMTIGSGQFVTSNSQNINSLTVLTAVSKMTEFTGETISNTISSVILTAKLATQGPENSASSQFQTEIGGGSDSMKEKSSDDSILLIVSVIFIAILIAMFCALMYKESKRSKLLEKKAEPEAKKDHSKVKVG